MRRTLTFLLASLSLGVFGQSNLDSLWSVWNDQSQTDSARLRALNKIGWDGYLFSNPDSAHAIAQQVYDIATDKGIEVYRGRALNTQGASWYIRGKLDSAMRCYRFSMLIFKNANLASELGTAYNNIGLVHWNNGLYDSAITYYKRGIEVFRKKDDLKGVSASLGNIGLIYDQQGNLNKALEYQRRALDISREIGDKPGVSITLQGIGNIYVRREKYDKALEYYQQALDVKRDLNEQQGVSVILGNLALIYEEKGDLDKATELARKSFHIKKEMNDRQSMPSVLGVIGGLFERQGMLDSAEYYLMKGIELNQEVGDRRMMASLKNSLAEIKQKKGQINPAMKLGQEALEIGQEVGSITEISKAAQILYEVHKTLGQPAKSLEMHELHIKMRDSLNNKETQEELIHQEYEYEYQKQRLADSLKSAREKELMATEVRAHKNELKAQKNQWYMLVAVLGFVITLTLFIWNRFRVTQRQKSVIEEKKKEADFQRHLVEEKNKEILDSINYAKRLQEAILPSEPLLKQELGDHFIFYQPKDIVAGDFYWMEKLEGDGSPAETFFAVADCTGHGVPGAMVSVVCSNALTKAVVEEGIRDPGKILDRTRELVVEKFSRSQKNVQDGMDIGLIKLENDRVLFAGANNPIWILSKGEVFETKGDKQPIGQYSAQEPFHTHQIELNPGDIIYLMTDGYQDQFGGNKGKKLKPANLKKIITSIGEEPLPKQEEHLRLRFKEWRDDLEQIDDVCLAGIRV